MHGRRGSSFFVVACLVLGAVAGPSAGARAAGASSKRVKVALLDVKSGNPKDTQLVQGLSQVVAQVLSGQPALQVLTSSDIRTMLGFEAQKQLLGCTDSSCLAQIGGALGVRYVIAPELARVGTTFLITVTVLDVAAAEATARDTERTADENALIDAITRAARAVLPKILGHRLVPTHLAPAAATEAAPAGGRGVLAWSLTGAGAVGVLAGGLLLGSAWSTYGRYQAGQTAASPTGVTVTQGDAHAAETRAGIGVAALAVGAAAVAGSFFLPHPRSEPATVGMAIVPGGAYASVTVPLGF